MGYPYDLPPLHMCGPPPPPPPPPPRSSNSRRASEGSDGSFSKVSMTMERPSQVSKLHEMCTAECSSQGGCPKCAELVEVVKKLELKVVCEVSRVEQETQNTQRAIAADLAKWKKEREACWKHVGELKDQNRLLMQRNYEMEVQNGHLQRHVTLLQEQLQMFKDNQAGLQAVLKGMSALSAAQAAPTPLDPVIAPPHNSNTAALLGGSSLAIPRLPHSGADIW